MRDPRPGDRPAIDGGRPFPELRRIPTREADVFVPWSAVCVREVIRSQGITADDFDTHAPRLKEFIRDLVPLAAQEALAGQPDRRLARLVRALFRRLHGDWPGAENATAEVAAHG